MRIVALVGLGLPVLAVSGAVAFGAISEISRSLKPSPSVQSSVSAPMATSNAISFVAAGKAEWGVQEETALIMPGFQDPAIGSANTSTLGKPDIGTSKTIEINPPVVEMLAAAIKPMATHADKNAPRVIVTTKPKHEKSAPASQAHAKRPFKMPWQTGIFQ